MTDFNELLEEDATGGFEEMTVTEEARSIGLYSEDEEYGGDTL